MISDAYPDRAPTPLCGDGEESLEMFWREETRSARMIRLKCASSAGSHV